MESLESWLGKPRPSIDGILDDYYEFLPFRDTLEEDEDENYDSMVSTKVPLLLESTTFGAVKDDHPLVPMRDKFAKSLLTSSSTIATYSDSIIFDGPTDIDFPLNAVNVGGATMKNPSLVLGTSMERFTSMPIMLLGVDRPLTDEGILLMTPPPPKYNVYTRSAFPTSTPPVLLLSSVTSSDLKIEGHAIPESTVGDALAASTSGDIVTAKAASYVLTGDVDNLFGIPGLSGKLYKFQSDDGDGVVKEKVRPKRGKIQDKRLGTLLPFMDVESLGNSAIEFVGESLAKLPDAFKSLEFVYSEDENDYFFEPGLRVEADVAFEGALQPVADALKTLFNTGSSKNKPPQKLRLSAHLTKIRENRWAKRPKVKIFTLRGSVAMTLWAGGIFNFTQIGVELRFKRLEKASDKDEGDEEDKKDEVNDDDNKDADLEEVNENADEHADKQAGENGDETVLTKKAPERESLDKSKKPALIKKRRANGELKDEEVGKDQDPANAKNGNDAQDDDIGNDGEAGEGETKDKDEEGEDDAETKEEKKKKKLTVGVGLFGTVDIHKLPGSTIPLHAKYRMRKLGKEYELMAETDEWRGAFGIEHLTVTSIKFSTVFDSSKFGESFKTRLSAKMKLGKATLDLTGELAKEETFLEGEASDLTWNEMVRTYRQIMGVKLQDNTQGNDLEFKNLRLKIGTKGLSFHGEATFNGTSSAEATVTFDGEGLTVEGKLENYKIQGTDIEIKLAHLDIFVGRKDSKSKSNDEKADADADDTEDGHDDGEDADPEGHDEGAEMSEKALALVGAPSTAKKGAEVDVKSAKIRAADETTIESDEDQPDDKETKDDDEAEKEKPVKFKGRPSRFAIKGEVNFAEIKVLVGFHVSNTKEKGKQWVLYGAVGNALKLADLAPDLQGTWLDVALIQPALIASSEALEEDNDLIPLKYPVSKGLSFCCTIEPVDQLNKLSGKDATEVHGIRLVASVSKKKLEITLWMPSSFAMDISEATRIGDFNIGVEISKTPGLNIGGILRLTLKEQKDPLKFVINLHADIVGMSGSIACDSVWKNPFGISDKVEITEMRGELGFLYATVFVSGPSKFGVAAAGHAGKIQAAAAFAISQRPDEQVFSIDLSNLNIWDIIEFAADAYSIRALKQLGLRQDFLIFAEAHMYFSTGGTIAGKEYPAGISASGRIVVCGKTASFEGEIGENGFKFLGAVDEFQLGPLEVRSASGAKQAKLEIEVGKEAQRLLIDGMIKFYALELKALVKANFKTVEIEALISIHLGEVLQFDLEARVKNVTDMKNLQDADVYFRAELHVDLLGKFCEAMDNFLDNIAHAVDEGIDSMEIRLGQLLHDVQVKLKDCQRELADAQREASAAEKVRDGIYAVEQKKAQAAREELARLQGIVDNAQEKNDAEVRKARRLLQEAQKQRDELAERKRKEYRQKLQSNQNERQKLEQQKQELENRKRVKFGSAIRDLENAEKEVAKLQGDYNYWNGQVAQWDRWLREAIWPWDQAQKWIELQAKIVARDSCGTAKRAAEAILQECKNLIWSTERLGLEDALNSTAAAIDKIGNSISALVTQGPDGFIEELVKDEQAEVDRCKRELDKLLANNSEYARVLRAAIRELDSKRPDLNERVLAADRAIAAARDNKKLKDLQARVERYQEEARMLNEKIRNITHTLEDIRKGVRGVTNTIKDMVHEIKNVTISVTRVLIEVDAQELRRGGKLTFEVDLRVFGKEVTLTVYWSPMQTAQELFTEIAKRAIANENATKFEIPAVAGDAGNEKPPTVSKAPAAGGGTGYFTGEKRTAVHSRAHFNPRSRFSFGNMLVAPRPKGAKPLSSTRLFEFERRREPFTQGMGRRGRW